MPGAFHYSGLNYELVQSTPSGSINIMWNQLGEKMKADSIMYMTPNFDPTIGFTYPEFGIWGNNLLNPMLAVQQTLQSFQNGSWMNNIGGGGNWLNNMWNNNWLNNMPWNNNNNNNNNNSVSSNPQYDALKALLTKYKELNPNDSKISDIDEALNKSGTAEEKMNALKEVYKKLTKSKLQKALLDLPEYKKMLDTAGYNFNGMNKDEDKELRGSLNKLENSIKAEGTDWGGTVNPSSDDILRTISYWNDSHKTDSDRGIIRMIASNLPREEEQRTMQGDYARKLANALTDKAAEFKAEFEGTFPKLDEAVKAVNDASAAIKDNKTCTSDKLTTLAKAFDKLYAMLRIMEAERVRNTIQEKYKFLNNISSTDTDFVTDDLVVNATKEDLKNEGITVDKTELDVVPKEEGEVEEPGEKAGDDKANCPKDPEEALEWLADEKQGYLGETKKEGIYTTKTASTTGEKARFYGIKDGKLVEFTNIKEIKDDGTIEKIDDTKAKDESKTIKSDDIIDYSTAIKTIEDNIREIKLEKISEFPDGTKCYRSKGKDEDGTNRYFVIRNNKLMKINGVLSNGSIGIKETGELKEFSDLTDDDFSEVTAADFDTTDLNAKKDAEAATAASTSTTPTSTTPTPDTDEIPDINTSSESYKDGSWVYDELSGTTSNWEDCKTKIKKTSKDSIRNFIAGYVKQRGSWRIGDNILEQIAKEYETTGFLGWGSTYRSGRRDLINHIVKTVLEYCEAHPELKNRGAYTKLKEKYDDGNGITPDDTDNHAGDKYNDDGSVKGIRGLDHLILDLLDINT